MNLLTIIRSLVGPQTSNKKGQVRGGRRYINRERGAFFIRNVENSSLMTMSADVDGSGSKLTGSTLQVLLKCISVVLFGVMERIKKNLDYA
ncbi:hypothetical protein CEXT_219071 [Caerostris extrusa]|uniref:Uncharacterized protein n=1 Tax=Caerostris extrusa TaxID=172846 RepID=A0AAV4WZQ0_CAEEX|nr:hypothetical protein CEXT_219071 [Caerostris extrusa]